LHAFRPLLLCLALMAATPMTRLRAVETTVPTEGSKSELENNQIDKPGPNAEPMLKDDRMLKLERQLSEIEQQLKINDESNILGISWPLLLAGGIGLLGLMLALTSLKLKEQQRNILKLNKTCDILLRRIGGVEVQMEQERVMNRRRAMAEVVPKSPSAQPQPQPQPQPSQPIAWPSPSPVPQPAPGPEPVSKALLVNALNVSNRQPLREAATAELNITTESENALAMGRAIATELEEVPGGGSYWLVTLQGQHMLFPTDRTLKGFAAAQPAKGLFHYEQQTIAQPQLIEPALLENCGTGWSVQTMGRIATP